MVTQEDVDWFRSDEAKRDCGVTSEEAAEVERLFANVDKVRTSILEAFSEVTLGDGLGLREADGIDDRKSPSELARLRQSDEKQDWTKISFDDLDRYAAGWWCMDAQSLRFHLPAFLLADLAEQSEDFMTFRLSHPSDKRDLLRGILNQKQKHAVRLFLEHVLWEYVLLEHAQPSELARVQARLRDTWQI